MYLLEGSKGQNNLYCKSDYRGKDEGGNWFLSKLRLWDIWFRFKIVIQKHTFKKILMMWKLFMNKFIKQVK